MSQTLSTQSRSLDSLSVSVRCGRRPKAPQMRQIDVCDSPASFAIERSDQWGASAGDEVRVRPITFDTPLGSVSTGGYPC